MAHKKIIFVIVEGPSDDEALGVILKRIYGEHNVYTHITHRDITTDKGITSINIIARVGNEIRDYARNNSFKKSDFKEIIHIMDTDGAYIANANVFEDQSVDKSIYSTSGITTCNKTGIELRNQQKRENMNKLCSCKTIWCKPYRAFYMSCNLDHVLYDKLNSSDQAKEADSFRFAKQYKDNIPCFLQFISASDFSVMGSYQESWDYIKQDLHSLERHTNLGLCFPQKTEQTE